MDGIVNIERETETERTINKNAKESINYKLILVTFFLSVRFTLIFMNERLVRVRHRVSIYRGYNVNAYIVD